ncbi:hypothetical protein PVAND_001517 [Polypedilum vanderplanki]|uniref:Ionotropic receptor n=1 Tax=Polypedilum vanderplanki TaxID=319348 RepID=A0A9J6BNN1_POLVA|nr:hypothetical protein PVAND_001517 [Polypedilum vanderplanki]
MGKLISTYLICIIILNSTKPSNSLNLSQDSTQSIARAISDVIHEFYIKQNIKFDLIIFQESSNHINDVIDDVTKKLSKEIPINIKQLYFWNNRMSKSAIIFIKTIENLYGLQKNPKNVIKYDENPTNLVPENLKFLIYVEEIKSFHELTKIETVNDELLLHWQADFRFYEFFIYNDKNHVKLSANLLYSNNHCGYFKPALMNYFSKKSQKWILELENYDHFRNFYGCLLKFSVNLDYLFYMKEGPTNYPELINNHEEIFLKLLSNENLKFYGLTYELIDLMAQKLNFTYHFSISHHANYRKLYGTKNFVSNRISSIHLPITFIRNKKLTHFFHFSQPFVIHKTYFLVSLNDLYNNYEKLMFPFDEISWILIFFTFGLTFGVTFALRQSPQRIGIVFFGRGINNPAYNALAIFMGISQLRLPTESFCRFILLMYIWFCLMIRTCWQSKMFEFMTSDMRKPLPESFEDLKEMNYTIVFPNFTASLILLDEIAQGRERPNMLIFNDTYYFELYKQALKEKLNTKYAFLVTEEVHLFWNITFGTSLPILQNERVTKEIGYSLPKNNIIAIKFMEFVDNFIQYGITKQLFEYGFWYLFRNFNEEPEDPRRILSMSDLEFGFVIFLGFLMLSIVVFICELHTLYLKRKLKKLLAQSISKAISDVIHELYIAQNIKFDFIVYGKTTNYINDIIDEAQKQLSPKLLIFVFNIWKWNHVMDRSAVIFIKTIDKYQDLLEISSLKGFENPQIINSAPEKLKFFVYVEEIKSFYQIFDYQKPDLNKINLLSDMRFYEFLIVETSNQISLYATVLYSEKFVKDFQRKN